MPGSTIKPEEIARFDAMAARWWDPNGPMRALHRMNQVRVAWIEARIDAAFPAREALRILDVGCGGGLAAEALARGGHQVMGIDAAPDAVAAAAAHASGLGLPLSYRVAAPEDLVKEGATFPVITALEVIEHVASASGFLQNLANLLEPGGLLVLSTLNRTARSYVTAKVGAEYVLRWLPVGTHDWRRFLTPAELAQLLRGAGLRPDQVSGLSLDPLTRRWRSGGAPTVNYLMSARA